MHAGINVLGAQSGVERVFKRQLNSHDMGPPDCIRERQERVSITVVTVVTAGAFIARSSQRRIGVAAAAAVTGVAAVTDIGTRMRRRHLLLKSRGKRSNSMSLQCAMVESTWQRRAVHNKGIDGKGIAVASGLRVRRVNDTNS